MNRRMFVVGPVLLSMILTHWAAGTDWPQFRGPRCSGASSDDKVPLQWSDTKNVK